MVKKIGIIFFLVVAAHCAATTGLSFAQQTECPPECVTDSMEIVTWYPSPYSEYEELRLYPISDSNSECNDDNRGLMYYDKDFDKVKLCKGSAGLNNWQDLGGGNVEFETSSFTIGCDSTNQGQFVYDQTKKLLRFCNGTDWQLIYMTDAIPAAPVLLSVNQVLSNSILLRWSGDSVKNYEIYRGTSQNPTVLLAAVSGLDSEYQDATISSSEPRYYYRLKAIGEYGKSDFSNELSVTLCWASGWIDSHTSACQGTVLRDLGLMSIDDCYNLTSNAGELCVSAAYSSPGSYRCRTFSSSLGNGCGACTSGDMARNICHW